MIESYQNRQILQMKYHPAKKEIQFKRFQNGQEIEIREDSKLKTYMKREFVLQLQGNTFFDDIARAFAGLEEVMIEVITTELDYQDFEQMVQYYNNNSKRKCIIHSKLKQILPDMNSIYNAVKEYGEKVNSTLSKCGYRLYAIATSAEDKEIQNYATNFIKKIDKEIKNIEEKIKNLKDNRVNLCFTGVYSSGKSTLINAILGYRILPEYISSETAKMMIINSPRENEGIKVEFKIEDKTIEIKWNDEYLEIIQEVKDNSIIQEIQQQLDNNKFKKQHEQIYAILELLNKKEEISSEIRICFPIPLDKNNVQFTIYDTPGTDSNNYKHQEILKEALKEQTHSILVFVATPDKLEGKGNDTLLKYLKEIEEKNSKAMIDMGRSLFVINKADTVESEEREALQKEKIKNEKNQEFNIKLENKKLFFISAKQAYASKAVDNKIYETREYRRFEEFYEKIQKENDDKEFYYSQNKYALSEMMTGKMIENCNIELEKAKENKDKVQVNHIGSGMYALETEILNYGQKYASSVKTFAMIKSVEDALETLRITSKFLEKMANRNIEDAQRAKKELEESLKKSIEDEYEKRKIKNEAFPEDVLDKLSLSGEDVQKQVKSIVKKVDEKELKGWFFGYGQIIADEKKKEKITKNIESTSEIFIKNFIENSESLIKREKQNFIEKIREIVENNENISKEVKEYIINIKILDNCQICDVTDIDKLYKNNFMLDNFFNFLGYNILNKKGFIAELEELLENSLEGLVDKFKNVYSRSLNNVCEEIKNEYIENLESYSSTLKIMNTHKEYMLKWKELLKITTEDIEKSRVKLEKLIEGEIN